MAIEFEVTAAGRQKGCHQNMKLAIALILLTTTLFAQETKPVPTSPNNYRIDYIEFPTTDIAKTKTFYEQVFGWKFTDYGPDYTSFADGRLSGGFSKEGTVSRGGPLVVLYATDLDATEKKLRDAGGTIVKDAFTFPGNVLAVWSEK